MKLIIQTHNSQSGFSMIELMVVVVIIGILGSFAIPAYQDYIVKTKVMELFTIVQPVKLAVTEALITGKGMETITHESLGLSENEGAGGSISRISVANGVITVTGNSQTLGLQTRPLAITFTPTIEEPSGMIQWACSTIPAEMRKYTPASCHAE